MEEYNIKRHYCTKHAAKFDDIKSQLWFDKVEQIQKSLMFCIWYCFGQELDVGNTAQLVFQLSYLYFNIMCTLMKKFLFTIQGIITTAVFVWY